MILIFTKGIDPNIHAVERWLKYYKANYLVINSNEDKLCISHIDINNNIIDFSFNQEVYFSLNEITSCWYWRGGIPLGYEKFSIKTILDSTWETPELRQLFYNYSLREFKVVKKYVTKKLFEKPAINHPLNSELNKLEVLDIALNCGLDIPTSEVINQKQHLSSKSLQEYITKPLGETVHDYIENGFITSFTERVHDLDVDSWSLNFPYTLIQKNIQKKFEIRSFFFDKKFYSMAIFSQKDEQTSTDFRKYNLKKPNRNTPYQLPKSIEDKLSKVFDALDLDSGSADLIYDSRNKYVFLEINPVGQWLMTSNPCNYYLDKKIAEWLINTI